MRSFFTSLEAVGISFEESNLDVDHVCRDRSNQHSRCCRLQQTSTSTIWAQILVCHAISHVIDPQQHFASPSCTKHIRSCHTHLSCNKGMHHLDLYSFVVERQKHVCWLNRYFRTICHTIARCPISQTKCLFTDLLFQWHREVYRWMFMPLLDRSFCPHWQPIWARIKSQVHSFGCTSWAPPTIYEMEPGAAEAVSSALVPFF